MIKNCKRRGKVEIIEGYCEMAEECFNDGIKCNKCRSLEDIKKGNQVIKEYCEQALVRGYF